LAVTLTDWHRYIHGTSATTDYFNLSPSYKNPADTESKQSAKLTISPTALWNSDMWRTELIPLTGTLASCACSAGSAALTTDPPRTGTFLASALRVVA